MEVPVRVRLAQADARGLGAKFPFAERLQEIFLCVLRLDFPESRRLTRFDKKRVVRNGGVSLIRRHRQVTIHTALAPGGYMLVPSTWELDVNAQFELTVHCDCAPGVVTLEE